MGGSCHVHSYCGFLPSFVFINVLHAIESNKYIWLPVIWRHSSIDITCLDWVQHVPLQRNERYSSQAVNIHSNILNTVGYEHVNVPCENGPSKPCYIYHSPPSMYIALTWRKAKQRFWKTRNNWLVHLKVHFSSSGCIIHTPWLE